MVETTISRVFWQTLHVAEGAEGVAWRYLYERIRDALSDGQLSPGSAAPAERELAERLGISRGTVKRCYDQLRQEGLLAGRGRGGSVLQSPKAALPTLGQLKGFTQEMKELGRVPSTVVVSREVSAERVMASLFGQNSQAQLLHVVRIRLADAVPMTRESAWYNLSRAPGFKDWTGEGSAYDFLRVQCSVRFGRASQTVEAVLSSTAETQAFGFAAAQPCLLFKRKVYDTDGHLIEYVEGCFRGDLYAYQIPLQI
jgi:GntR family transcriptional regulator